MIKAGILHGADTRHKAVHCRSEVEAMEILKTLNFLKQQHCTHKQKDPNTWTDIKKKGQIFAESVSTRRTRIPDK